MKKVLIIDDEQPILDMYSQALKEYKISTALTGQQGLATAIKERPDLIYLDIIMPQLNGLDVLKELKNNEETANIPVVLLTNLPKEASAEKAKSLGATDYLVKVDFEPAELAKKTKEVLG